MAWEGPCTKARGMEMGRATALASELLLQEDREEDEELV